MQTSYNQTPGPLNLKFVRGDDFSALIDFSASFTDFDVFASIFSLVTNEPVYQFTITEVSAANGTLNIALSDTQTADIPKGTYGWKLWWVDGSVTRTGLAGFVEVL